MFFFIKGYLSRNIFLNHIGVSTKYKLLEKISFFRKYLKFVSVPMLDFDFVNIFMD